MTTYKELYDTALSEIIAVCQNVEKYSNVPDTVKSGYTRVVSLTGGDTTNGGKHWDESTGSEHSKTISARFRVKNPIAEVYRSVVETQFESYINSCGYSNILNNNTTPRGEILFMMAVSEFVTAKVYTAQGANSSRVSCYNPDATPTVVAYDKELTIKPKDTNINSAILKNTGQINVNYIHEFVQ